MITSCTNVYIDEKIDVINWDNNIFISVHTLLWSKLYKCALYEWINKTDVSNDGYGNLYIHIHTSLSIELYNVECLYKNDVMLIM